MGLELLLLERGGNDKSSQKQCGVFTLRIFVVLHNGKCYCRVFILDALLVKELTVYMCEEKVKECPRTKRQPRARVFLPHGYVRKQRANVTGIIGKFQVFSH